MSGSLPRMLWTLVKKNLAEARWTLILSALLFLLIGRLAAYVSWNVEQGYLTLRESFRAEMEASSGPGVVPTDRQIEDRLGGRDGTRQVRRAAQRLREAGGIELPPAGRFEMRFWGVGFPPTLILIAVWAIARGAAAVGGEMERGTIDLILARPVPRWLFLLSHLVAAVLGVIALVGALMAGTLLAHWLEYPVARPPTFAELVRPATGLAALGFAIFGVTLWASCHDLVRWRPTLLGSGFVLMSLIATITAEIPAMIDYRAFLRSVSIFTALDSEAAFLGAEAFARNVSTLLGVGSAAIAVGGTWFLYRDLPAGS